MFRIILAFFGYVKIPLAVIQASILQEDFFKEALRLAPESERFKRHYECQKAITEFLRTGRKLR